MDSKLILIADSDVVFAVELGIRLEKSGHRVVIVPDATRAMGYLYSAPFPPDLLITDLSMPEQDAIVFFRVVGESFPFLPVVVCAEYITAEFFREVYCAETRAFLRKPVNYAVLSTTITRMLDTVEARSRSIVPDNRDKTGAFEFATETNLCGLFGTC